MSECRSNISSKQKISRLLRHNSNKRGALESRKSKQHPEFVTGTALFSSPQQRPVSKGTVFTTTQFNTNMNPSPNKTFIINNHDLTNENNSYEPKNLQFQTVSKGEMLSSVKKQPIGTNKVTPLTFNEYMELQK